MAKRQGGTRTAVKMINGAPIVCLNGKPVAAVCIAPALLAKVLGDEGPELTIGTDADTAGALAKMGAAHVDCPVTEFVVDRDRKLVSSPAYMLAQNISEAAEGIEKTVAALIEMA